MSAGAGSSKSSTATAAAAPDFYTPPAQFDTTPGAVVRTEPMPVYLAAPAPGEVAQRTLGAGSMLAEW